jgi:hypothetical protein
MACSRAKRGGKGVLGGAALVSLLWLSSCTAPLAVLPALSGLELLGALAPPGAQPAPQLPQLPPGKEPAKAGKAQEKQAAAQASQPQGKAAQAKKLADYPESLVVEGDFEGVYKAALKTLASLKERSFLTDKKSGVISTRKAPVDWEACGLSEEGRPEIFFQRSILIKEVSDEKTRVSVVVTLLDDDGEIKDKGDEDKQVKNYTRMVFYQQLNNIMNKTK